MYFTRNKDFWLCYIVLTFTCCNLNLFVWVSCTDMTSWSIPCSNHVLKHNHGGKALYFMIVIQILALLENSNDMFLEFSCYTPFRNHPYMRDKKYLLSNGNGSWQFVSPVPIFLTVPALAEVNSNFEMRWAWDPCSTPMEVERWIIPNKCCIYYNDYRQTKV